MLDPEDMVFTNAQTKALWNLSLIPFQQILRALTKPNFTFPGGINKGTSIELSIGDIYVSGVQNVEGLSGAIIRQLPNQILQDLYKNI